MSVESTLARCSKCQMDTVHQRTGANHILHALLTLLTCGLWVIVWFLDSVRIGGWVCSKCGLKGGARAGGGWLSGSNAVMFVFLTVGVFGIVLLLELSPDRERQRTRPDSLRQPRPSAGHSAADDALEAMLPAVADFVRQHEEFGQPVSVEPLPDWTDGMRQAVRFASGDCLVFYLRGNEVVTVYDSRSESGDPLWGTRVSSSREEPERSVAASPTLPHYTLKVVNLAGGGKYGDVIVPTFSRKTSASERESVLRAIADAEGLIEASLYSSESAYKANFSEAYRTEHPEALRSGYLGGLKAGRFTAGETIYP